MQPSTTTQIAKWLTAGFFFIILAFPFWLQDLVFAQQQDSKLLPFFDNQDNPIPVGFPPGQKLDITPPPPKLNSFDKAVLKVCGPIATRVNATQFKNLLSYYPDVIEKLQKITEGELQLGRKEKADFLLDLTDIWFKHQAFEHIFCGQIYNIHKIGGLHFYGRYLELQNKGIGGLLANNNEHQEVVQGVIYRMGIMIKQGEQIVSDHIKGYSYLTNAEDILLDATKIFKLQGEREGDCIYNVRDWKTGKSFPSVFVRKEKAIVTFYPDATPHGQQCRN